MSDNTFQELEAENARLRERVQELEGADPMDSKLYGRSLYWWQERGLLKAAISMLCDVERGRVLI